MTRIEDLRDDPLLAARNRMRVDSEMDMTPMVDVTFLLLIFFMITAAFALQKSFQIPTPKSDQASNRSATLEDLENDPEYVIVRLDEFNTYHVSAKAWDDEIEAPSRQDLLVALRRARAGNSDGTVANKLLLICNGEAMYEKVVQGIDAGNDVGMEDVKILTSND